MFRIIKILSVVIIAIAIIWFFLSKFSGNKTETNHQLLVSRIEAIGKLELVKYRISDVVEHKNKTMFLPDASVLLIINAEAVGCVDLTKITNESVEVIGDSVSIALPKPEICYVRINHKDSKVYDTKMAFFREANLVDEAYKAAEQKIQTEVAKSDILSQTEANAKSVLKPLLNGLGYAKIGFKFDK